jgi:hypothetical protein
VEDDHGSDEGKGGDEDGRGSDLESGRIVRVELKDVVPAASSAGGTGSGACCCSSLGGLSCCIVLFCGIALWDCVSVIAVSFEMQVCCGGSLKSTRVRNKHRNKRKKS